MKTSLLLFVFLSSLNSFADSHLYLTRYVSAPHHEEGLELACVGKNGKSQTCRIAKTLGDQVVKKKNITLGVANALFSKFSKLVSPKPKAVAANPILSLDFEYQGTKALLSFQASEPTQNKTRNHILQIEAELLKRLNP